MINRQAFSHTLMIAGLCSLASQAVPAAVEESDFRFDTTAALYDVCSVAPEAAEYPLAHQACRAFIQATVQYHDEVSARRKLKRLVCYPSGVTIEDGKQAFTTWAAKHAKDQKLMAEPAVVGMVRALAAKYPCSK